MMGKGIGVIGGGQMGEALIKGFLEKKIFSPENILVSEPISHRREYLEKTYRIKTTTSNTELIKEKSIILLAVKPQVMEDVLKEISKEIHKEVHLILTIAAGLPLSFYEKNLPEGTRIIRIMPNTCALVHESISAICKGKYAREEDIRLAEKIFSAIGEVVEVDEKLMDAVTALSGSGPAYVALFAEAMIDAGVRVGLPRNLAEKLVFQTILGTIHIFLKTGKNPYEVKSMVTSPGGTTISALEEFYKGGFSGIVISAILKAFERSKELSQLFK